jgi:tripartite-type tricarboxylate transporter receptor subunit TctC
MRRTSSTRVSRRNFMLQTGSVAAAGLATPALLLRPGRAFAAYPDRPIKLIVPNTPGGPSDVAARLLSAPLQDVLKTSVVVENVGGGGGNIGMGRAARAEADGYTLLVSTSGYAINPSLFDNVPYDALKDFAPIAEIATTPNIYAVRPDLGVTTMKDFIALIKKDPSKFNFATPPMGNTPHLATELLKLRENIRDMATVFHTGGGQAIQALLSGSVQCYCGAISTARAHIAAGTAVALAVTGETRWHDLPDIPTMIEAGYKDYVFDNYVGLSAPVRTPPEIVAQLEKEVIAILSTADMREKFAKTGFKVEARPGKAHMERLQREVPMYRRIIQDAGIKLPKGG